MELLIKRYTRGSGRVKLGKAKILSSNYVDDFEAFELQLISNIIESMRWCLNNIFVWGNWSQFIYNVLSVKLLIIYECNHSKMYLEMSSRILVFKMTEFSD